MILKVKDKVFEVIQRWRISSIEIYMFFLWIGKSSILVFAVFKGWGMSMDQYMNLRRIGYIEENLESIVFKEKFYQGKELVVLNI